MIGGMRIIKTVAKRLFKVQPINGFAADLSSFTVMQGATMLGLPVSTTHVASCSILGVGSAKRFKGVNWGVAGRMIITWVITLPISAAIAGIIITIMKLFM
jgi:PiT family inorganic phosphate transporter